MPFSIKQFQTFEEMVLDAFDQSELVEDEQSYDELRREFDDIYIDHGGEG